MTALKAEDTVDKAFYWSSVSRARKIKNIISQLNRKLPELLKEKAEPTITLTDYQLRPQQVITSTQTLQAEAAHPRRELWKPQTIQTKDIGQALKWFMENPLN